MRLFVAVDIPETVAEALHEIQSALTGTGEGIRPVEKNNIHITLKFLGEVREGCVNRVVNDIRKAVGGQRVFLASVEGTGCFGDPPRIVWAGIGKGYGKLVDMMKSLENSLSWVRKETRNPSPHITIARVKSVRNAREVMNTIARFKSVKFGEFHVKEVALKKSVLTPSGPRYETISVFPLKPAEVAGNED